MEYLTEQQRIDLITKLKNDDDFREDFAKNPAAALLEYYDVTLAPEDTPTGAIELPSKKEFLTNFDGYVDKANASISCQQIHWFNYQ